MTQSDFAAPSRYFVDESGTTGDLSRAGAGLDFKQQPVFALAAVGVDDEQGLVDRLAQIRTRRFPQAAELKSRKVMRRRPSSRSFWTRSTPWAAVSF